MIVTVYDDCFFEDERFSNNGINLTLERLPPDNEVKIKFEDDGGKELFSAVMEWEKLSAMMRRIETEI